MNKKLLWLLTLLILSCRYIRRSAAVGDDAEDRLSELPRKPQCGRRKLFRQALRDLDWIEGKNIAIEYRSGAGKPDTLPRLQQRSWSA